LNNLITFQLYKEGLHVLQPTLGAKGAKDRMKSASECFEIVIRMQRIKEVAVSKALYRDFVRAAEHLI